MLAFKLTLNSLMLKSVISSNHSLYKNSNWNLKVVKLEFQITSSVKSWISRKMSKQKQMGEKFQPAQRCSLWFFELRTPTSWSRRASSAPRPWRRDRRPPARGRTSSERPASWSEISNTVLFDQVIDGKVCRVPINRQDKNSNNWRRKIVSFADYWIQRDHRHK